MYPPILSPIVFDISFNLLYSRTNSLIFSVLFASLIASSATMPKFVRLWFSSTDSSSSVPTSCALNASCWLLKAVCTSVEVPGVSICVCSENLKG